MTIFTTALIVMMLVVAVRYSLKNQGLTWETFSEQRLDEARHSGRPVLIDFHADWCAPCKELEGTTLKDGIVVDASKALVRLKVDLTNFDSPANEPIEKRFDISGLPTLVFLSADGAEHLDARLVGFATPQEFVASVKSVTR